MNDEQLQRQLINAHACIPHDRSTGSLLEAVKTNQTTRYLKVWHDHGKIAGHGHLLVLVASIYDQVFFYTTEEMAERGVTIDVPTAVEEPHHCIQTELVDCHHGRNVLHLELLFHLVWSPSLQVLTDQGKRSSLYIPCSASEEPEQASRYSHNRAGHYLCTSCTAKCVQIR